MIKKILLNYSLLLLFTSYSLSSESNYNYPIDEKKLFVNNYYKFEKFEDLEVPRNILELDIRIKIEEIIIKREEKNKEIINFWELSIDNTIDCIKRLYDENLTNIGLLHTNDNVENLIYFVKNQYDNQIYPHEKYYTIINIYEDLLGKVEQLKKKITENRMRGSWIPSRKVDGFANDEIKDIIDSLMRIIEIRLDAYTSLTSMSHLMQEEFIKLEKIFNSTRNNIKKEEDNIHALWSSSRNDFLNYMKCFENFNSTYKDFLSILKKSEEKSENLIINQDFNIFIKKLCSSKKSEEILNKLKNLREGSIYWNHVLLMKTSENKNLLEDLLTKEDWGIIRNNMNAYLWQVVEFLSCDPHKINEYNSKF